MQLVKVWFVHALQMGFHATIEIGRILNIIF
jgi:hypothetical protein